LGNNHERLDLNEDTDGPEFGALKAARSPAVLLHERLVVRASWAIGGFEFPEITEKVASRTTVQVGVLAFNLHPHLLQSRLASSTTVHPTTAIASTAAAASTT